MSTVYMFPGQGSQSKGMGEELFGQFPDETAAADEILGYSIRELCVDDPREELGKTEFTQPALYVVNCLSYLAKVADDGVTPDFVAGHSLGEYSALYAAGAFDFATGLRLVQKRGAIMSKASGGGMAAVLALDPEKIREALDGAGFDTVDIANYNGPGQTVISGLKADVEASQEALSAAGAKRVVVLNVSGAFHSRYMGDAAAEFAEFISDVSFGELTIPVIANLTAAPYEQDEIAKNLVSQIDHSVRWTETILSLKEQADAEFIEVGPGRVLKSMMRGFR